MITREILWETFSNFRNSNHPSPAHGPHNFELFPPLSFFPHLSSPPPHCSSIHKPPPRDLGPWSLKRSELSGCWQMHRYYIYNKHFVNNLVTLFFYQTSFINNIVNKWKSIYWFNYKTVIGSQRKISKT